MRYLGSKRRIKKHILPIILADRQPNQLYWEPFVGGANTFQDVANPRLGSDLNPYLIALLAAVRDGWIPPTVLTEEEYKQIKANPDKYPKELVGFAGHCTFGAKWFTSFARRRNSERVDARELMGSLIKKSELLNGSSLVAGHYSQIGQTIPNNSIIYCDPPYRGEAYGYYGSKFDSDSFWQWAAEMSKHHQIFVSEFTAPNQWCVLWEGVVDNRINRRNNYKPTDLATEKLFKLAT